MTTPNLPPDTAEPTRTPEDVRLQMEDALDGEGEMARKHGRGSQQHRVARKLTNDLMAEWQALR